MKYQNNLSISTLVALASLYTGLFMGSASAIVLSKIEAGASIYEYRTGVLVATGSILVIISAIAMFMKIKWSRLVSSIGLHIIVVSFIIAPFKFNLEDILPCLALIFPNVIMILVIHNKNIK